MSSLFSCDMEAMGSIVDEIFSGGILFSFVFCFVIDVFLSLTRCIYWNGPTDNLEIIYFSFPAQSL